MTRCATLVVDMQNDFFAGDVLASVRGPLTAAVNDLNGLARAAQMPVIWVKTELRADLRDALPDTRRRGKPVCVRGTLGAEILPELTVAVSDHVVVKTKYSAFFRTNLDRLLSSLGVKTLIICGVHTHACVRTTLIDAYQRDYEIVLALDGIASYDPGHHDVSLRYMVGRMALGMRNEEIRDRAFARSSSTGTSPTSRP